MTRDREFDLLWSSSLGMLRVWTAHVGRTHGLLDALADAPRTPADLARFLALDARAVRLWCEAAHALEIAELDGESYRVTRRVAELLVDDAHPDFLGGQLSYLALRGLDLAPLGAFMATGESAPQPHLTAAFSEATRWDHSMVLRIIEDEPALRRRLDTPCHVLDVGCGTAAWDITLAQAFPRPRFVGVDPDSVAIEMGQRRVKQAGLEDRITLRCGDGETVTFDREFDLVHLGEVLCRADDGAGILDACARTLAPDGHLVVVEGLLDDRVDPRSPDQQLVRAMQLEFALQGARFLERRALHGMLANAGFAIEKEVHAGGGLWVVLARRPPGKDPHGAQRARP